MSKSDIKIYIEENWLSGDSCLMNIPNAFLNYELKDKLHRVRLKFVEKLINEGFTIIYDINEIDDNTMFLSMDPYVFSTTNGDDYKRLFDQSVIEAGGRYLFYPKTLHIEEYLKNPFFPAVFKNELLNGGQDKFLIENQEQLNKIKNFYNKYKEDSHYKSDFELVVFQQYLETPSDYQSYLRVLVGGNGDVLGASLKYSAPSNRIDKMERKASKFESIFLDPSSDYYIGASKMFNYYSNGDSVDIPQKSYSFEKKEILKEHNFNPNAPKIPEEILEVCANIMKQCNRMVGVLAGFDFIFNEKDQKWYYLEMQAFPAYYEWARRKRISVPNLKTPNGYLRGLELELQVRYEALMCLVNEKIDLANQKILMK